MKAKTQNADLGFSETLTVCLKKKLMNEVKQHLAEQISARKYKA